MNKNHKTLIDVESSVKEYLSQVDWRVNANANQGYSLGGLILNVSGKVIANYWLNHIYAPEIGKAHRVGDFHIHDLDMLSGYCAGWSLRTLLMEGFNGIPGKVEAKPPKHLSSAVGQMVNFLGTLQNEWAGAVAFSSFDTYIAPFLRKDNLSYQQVKQGIQELIYNLNVPSRWGSQTPFTNLTFDWVCPEDLREQIPYIGCEEMPFSYGDLQAEMDMINRAFIEVMTEGDAKGRIFTFPLPTYNITSDFPWDSPNVDLLFEMTAKFGLPYFSNFIRSDMKPNMVRSMCCRLMLDLTELLKRGNGLFGSAEQTGCYDNETEFFTNNGWKFFKDVTDTDLALSMDMENGVPEFVNIDSYYEYDFNGDLIHFKSLRVDLLVTPNHRMIYKDRHHGIQVKTAQQIQPYRTFDIPNNRPINRKKTAEFFVLPELRIRNRFYPEVRIPYELWAEFMGFYLSEGYCDKKETSEKTKQYRIIISQTKKDFKKDIERILDKFPFSYSKFDHGYQLDNKPLCLYLRQFGCHNEKFIPQDLKERHPDILEILWNALIKGDGHKRKDRSHVETYWTTSLRLVEDIREILIYMGFNSSCKIQKKKDSFIKGRLISKYHQKDCFAITKITKSCNSVMAHRTTTVPYKGKVYCLGVKHGSLLVKRKGHINWCGNSLGVVTINCARLGYQYKNDEAALYQRLDTLLALGRDSLEVKRQVIQQHMDNGLFPFTKRYLGTLRNHFSTLGVNGINEMIRNFTNDQHDITSEWGQAFAVRLLEHIRARMIEFQEETGHMYNLEATPAEGTTYRFAKEDKKRYPDMIQAGSPERPYYTNSSQLPVGFTDDPFEALELQDELQTKYTGGCIEKGVKVITNKGAFNIEEIVKDFKSLSPLKALSYNQKTGQSEWDLITDAVKIDVARHNKIKVVAKRGIEITTSDWHPFFVVAEEKIAFTNQCPKCAKHLINLKALGNHLRYTPACQEYYRKLPKDKVIEKRADELVKGDNILQNAQNMLPEKSLLNPDLAYLIGFFVGDGLISEIADNRGGDETQCRVRFFSKTAQGLDRIIPILNRFFDCQVAVIQSDHKSIEKPFMIETTVITDFLLQYCFVVGQNTSDRNLPSAVKRHLSKENFYSFIMGLMDNNGYIGEKSGYVEYHTVSTRLVEDVIEMFSMAGLVISEKRVRRRTKRHAEFYTHTLFISLPKTIAKCGAVYQGEEANDNVLFNHPARRKRSPVARVLDTSKVEVQDNDFYDLTTEHNHNYLAGNNNFVFVHNTVLHLYMNERISSAKACKNLVRRVLERYRLPYITVTPTFSICPVHGYLAGEHDFCPLCDDEKLANKEIKNESKSSK